MFKINDMVVYGTQGVCKIIGAETKDFMGEKKEFMVLKPVVNEKSTIYVPMDNEKVLAKIRKTLSRAETDALIDSMPQKEPNWIEDDAQRKETYRAILNKGERGEIIGMMKAIFARKQEREASGKRLHISDERFLKEAEQLLHGELQYVLELNESQLIGYISQRIEKRA